uniref:Uncharacterized protein n=1 Tax=Spermophilus dauricus TaxID=99837 RepID=A0A8C9PUF8_SPEDA
KTNPNVTYNFKIETLETVQESEEGKRNCWKNKFIPKTPSKEETEKGGGDTSLHQETTEVDQLLQGLCGSSGERFSSSFCSQPCLSVRLPPSHILCLLHPHSLGGGHCCLGYSLIPYGFPYRGLGGLL